MALTHLILGSNSSDKHACLSQAISSLEKQVGIVIQRSSVYESEAWGYKSENSYLNQALSLITSLSPHELLSITQSIEKDLGRTTKTVNGVYSDRPIDIDILFYDDLIVASHELSIPHPRIAERRFVLEALNEIDSRFIHPITKKSIHQILSECDDDNKVTRLI